MKKLLIFTSICESGLGICLMLFPSLVLKLIFGIESNDTLNLLGHFVGIVFFCFGLACYPLKGSVSIREMITPVRGMLSYNLIAGVFFGYLVFEGVYKGVLLIPAFIAHTLIASWFILLLFKSRPD